MADEYEAAGLTFQTSVSDRVLRARRGTSLASSPEMSTTTKKLARREVLAALSAGVGAAFAACSSSPTSPNTNTSSGGTSSGTCAVIPSETEGPYPDTSNAGDMVFADGVQNELATVTGNTTNGYTATLQIGINA